MHCHFGFLLFPSTTVMNVINRFNEMSPFSHLRCGLSFLSCSSTIPIKYHHLLIICISGIFPICCFRFWLKKVSFIEISQLFNNDRLQNTRFKNVTWIRALQTSGSTSHKWVDGFHAKFVFCVEVLVEIIWDDKNEEDRDTVGQFRQILIIPFLFIYLFFCLGW